MVQPVQHGEVESFSQLIVDHFAPCHIFIAEGEGARRVLELFSEEPPVPGWKAIYYVDSVSHISPGYAESLSQLGVENLGSFKTRLDLLRHLPALIPLAPRRFRLYISASRFLIEAIEYLAAQLGVDDGRMFEICDPHSVMVDCAICAAKTSGRLGEELCCSGCGSSLRISGYYRTHDHMHLGVPANWPA